MSYYNDEDMFQFQVEAQREFEKKLKNTELAMAKLAWALHLNVNKSLIKEFAKDAIRYWRIEEPYCAPYIQFAHPDDKLANGQSIDEELKFIFELPKDE